LGTETHLDSTTTDNMIDNSYNIYRLDRNKFGGGVIIGIKNIPRSKSIDNITTDCFESVFAELSFKNYKYLIGSIYIAPNPTSTQINEVEKLIKKINNFYSDHKIILSDDFNINLLNSTSTISLKLLNLLNIYKLYQLVTEPTYPSHPKYSSNFSLIDLLITNDKNLLTQIRVQNSISETCDHLAVFTVIADQPIDKPAKITSEKIILMIKI
jgi:hypothetical protein